MVARVAHNHKVKGSSPFPATIWKIREENSRKADVDKSASSSCLMCLLGGFASANLALPTSISQVLYAQTIFERYQRRTVERLM